jgi:hypothetical protein
MICQISNTEFLLFETPPKCLTDEQKRLKNIGEECFLRLRSDGMSRVEAFDFVFGLLEPKLQGFVEWQYSDLLA